MNRKLRSHVDHAFFRRIDPDSPCMEMELSADPSSEEGLGPAIFGIADDRVADKGHVRPKLVGPAGKRLQLDPGRAIARSIDEAPAGLRGKAALPVEMHFFAARSRLLGKRRVDQALGCIGHPDDERPIDLARGPPGEGLGEMARGTRAPRNEECTRRVLVETVNQLGASALVRKSVEKAVEMLGRLRPALGREPRRLVEDEGAAVLMDHHVANELLLVRAQRVAPRLLWRRTGGRNLERRYPYLLPGLDPVAGNGPFPGKAQLARPRPARDEIEADLRHVPLEPAVETDPVILVGHGKGNGFAHERAISES